MEKGQKKIPTMRRWISGIVGSMLAISLAACGSAPSGGTAEKPQTNPANEQKPGAQAPAATGFDAEWAKIVEAAKKEGEVVIYGQPFVAREEAMMEFQKVHPEIKVKYTGMRPNESSPKIVAEQQQGKFLVDLYFEVPPNYPNKDVVGQIRDYIVRPELKDDKAWVDGYEKGYELTSNANVYPFGVQVIPFIHVNNDFIPKGQIKSIDDLLDPKWKGKIIGGSFDRPAQGSSSMNGLKMTKGEDFIKKLVEDQQLYMIFDNRQILENFATGKYPIMIGPTANQVAEFTKNGVIKQVERIEPPILEAVSPVNIGVLKNAPHPNATKVFVDWFLSPAGQQIYMDKTDDILSRRVGVKNDPNIPGWDKVKPKYSHHSVEGQKSNVWILQYGKEALSKQSQRK